jgi:hypothetical protein
VSSGALTLRTHSKSAESSMSLMPPPTSLRVRTCFLSDIHLGFRGCRAEYLLDFLRNVDCETAHDAQVRSCVQDARAA